MKRMRRRSFARLFWVGVRRMIAARGGSDSLPRGSMIDFSVLHTASYGVCWESVLEIYQGVTELKLSDADRRDDAHAQCESAARPCKRLESRSD